MQWVEPYRSYLQAVVLFSSAKILPLKWKSLGSCTGGGHFVPEENTIEQIHKIQAII